MRITDTTPIEDGYYMPAEYDRHKATIMIWPVRTGSWPYNAVAAQNVFVDIAHIISRHEKVYTKPPKEAWVIPPLMNTIRLATM